MSNLQAVSPGAARRGPSGRSFEGRQRQRIHTLKRTLDYTEDEYRTMLSALTGHRYSRDLSADDLGHVVAVFTQFALERRQTEKLGTAETDQERYEREQDELIAMLSGY